MRWLRAALATIGIALLALGGLAWFIDREGAQQRNMAWSDGPVVTVVLGAPVARDLYAGPTLEARVQHAVNGLREGDVMLVSGGVGRYGRAEGLVGCHVAKHLGIAREHCLVEDQSHSTLESVEFSLAFLKKNFPEGFHIVVVADPYQLPRARRLFERLSGEDVGTRPVLEGPRYLRWPERIGCTLREAPALARDLLLTR